MNQRNRDEHFMKLALKLARLGERWVSPNPMVGAVIVKGNEVVGQGYHKKFGDFHAEINALAQAGARAKGATMYVTLEPCCHFGKTPPCVERLIKAELARIVIGTVDPNPMVKGQGISALTNAGIEVTVGLLEEECRRLNERFFKYMTTGLPFITIKLAQTIDGKIATITGDARWISSLASRRFAHHLRSIHDAVLVGAGTIQKDNPELTVRLVKGRNPLRVVVDARLIIPEDAVVLKDQDKAKTIIFTTKRADSQKRMEIARKGIEIVEISEDHSGLVDLKALLSRLGEKGISSVLVEGGSALFTSFLREKLGDRFITVIAPKLFGHGIPACGELGVSRVNEAISFTLVKTRRLGEDLILEARPAWPTADGQP